MSSAMATFNPVDEEDLRRFRDAIHAMPMDTFLEVASTFSMRELLILADDEQFAPFAHSELYTRALGVVRRFKLPEGATFDMMEDNHTVMSGSAALSIAAPGPWKPVDIDFYCPEGKLEDVVAFLRGYDYEVVQRPTMQRKEPGVGDSVHMDSNDSNTSDDDITIPATSNPYAKHVMKTVVLLKHNSEGLTLNVIESILPCAEAAIFGFHSTVVMNVVTSKGVSCFYPRWTFYNKGVVNRPDGIAQWNPRDEEKEKAALGKYTARGYSIATDCMELHEENEASCDACAPKLKRWSDGTSMTFRYGDTFGPSGKPFSWRLGAQPRELESLFWLDRGVVIVVQGDGDGRAIVYDGLAKETKRLTAEGVRILVESTL